MSNKQILPVVQALCDGHVLVMKSGAQTLRWLGRCNGNPHDAANLRIANEAASMANLSARLMEHQQSAHGLWLRARHLPGMNDLGRAPAGSSREQAPAAKLHAAAGLARGRLNNDNPAGDYLKSPRCGARTRAGGCCRQPAMRNGRCRMHGGLSTGPRTPEGLARCRRTRLVHGFRCRSVLQFRSRAVHTARQLRDLTAGLRTALRHGGPAGHGVHRQFSGSIVGAGLRPAQEFNHRAHRDHRVGSVELSGSGSSHHSSVFSVPSVVKPSPAGQGVHRPDSVFQAGAGSKSAHMATRPDSLRSHLRSSVSICGSNPFPAGQGVHRSDSVSQVGAGLKPAPTGIIGVNRRSSAVETLVPAWHGVHRLDSLRDLTAHPQTAAC